jgi:hypothetical protein
MKSINGFKYFVIGLLALSLASCGKKDQEKTVTEKEIPGAVMQSFTNAFPGAVIKEYAEEVENGQKFYEISCEFKNRKIDAIYKPDGTVSAIEGVIPAEDLPDVVQQAISKQFPQFSLKLAEKIEKEGKTFFEVKLFSAKEEKKLEVVFSDIGKIAEKAVKKIEPKKEKGKEAEGENEEGGKTFSVPDKVASSFRAKFGAAAEIGWGKESDNEFEAEFKLNDKTMSACLDSTGKWLETESAFAGNELPAQVLNTLKSQFGPYQVVKAESLEKNGEPLVFEVRLEKGESNLEVVLDQGGKVVQKTILEENEEKEQNVEKEETE